MFYFLYIMFMRHSSDCPFTDVVTANLKLKNPSERKVCFKVKTTAPRRYCVRPNSGIIDPGAAVIISVMLQPFEYDPNEKSKHKFMVQTIFAPAAATDTEALTWADDLKRCPQFPCRFSRPLQNDADSASKPAAVLNSSKLDVPVAGKAVSAALDDSEMKKILEECRRLQTEASKLNEENRQLRDEGVRLRKVQRGEHVTSNSSSALGLESRAGSLPSLLVVIAAIFLGFFLGKFIL
uniref:Vesicle-associated membrane protein-associated protein A n=1 Tax=Cyprinus carpio TaxID=7962 RepID=A0A8C1VY87_CYPCA